jgi:hypothetical protein
MVSPGQVQKLQERRAGMSAEERQLEALETIADNMLEIRLELANIGRAIGSASRSSSFGR